MIFTINILQREIKIEPGYVFLCLAIVSLPINKELAGPFRFTDVFLVLALASVAHRIRISKTIFQYVFTLLLILVVSSMLGVWAYGIKNIQNLGFIYKFMVPLFPIFILKEVKVTPKRVQILHKLLFYVFIFLTVWVYTYLVLRFTGRIRGLLRPSFPFSGNFYQSDAHLYSCFLAMCLVMYNFYWKKKFSHGFLLTIFINAICLPAIVLTGSKTGIVIVAFSQFFHTLIYLKGVFTIKKRTFLMVLMLLPLVFYMLSKVDLDNGTLRLVERALDFNSGDGSSSSRIRKLLISFDQSSGTFFLFGVGLLSNFVTWYDGLIGSTNGFMGLFGVALFSLMIAQLIRSNYFLAKLNDQMKTFIPFAIILSSYIIANLITEYYLVTRGVLPTAVILTLLHFNIARQTNEQVYSQEVIENP
jgi:hypothetical protein